jgi:hypothetical protein
MGFAAVALVATGLGVLWLTRNAPEKFGGAMDFDTVQLLARAFDQALERCLRSSLTLRNEASLHAELAKCIVATARTGERDESLLAKNGYLMLQALRRNSSDNIPSAAEKQEKASAILMKNENALS